MRQKKHGRRRDFKVTLDFDGREVVEEPQMTEEFEAQLIEKVGRSTGTPSNIAARNVFQNLEIENDVHPGMDFPIPLFVENSNYAVEKQGNHYDGTYNRVQDKELLEIQDMRHCLSMHQPWASLLVAGIK